MKRCDRCGASVVDVVGSRQASMFDLPNADPRATDEARAELRAGRVLCSACQRTDDLPGMREAEQAERVDAVADLAGGQTFDIGESTIRTTLEPFPVADDQPPIRVRVIRGQTALSRFLSDCPEDPIGEIARPAGIRSPFSFGPTFAVFQWGRRRVFFSETQQGRFEVFEVPAGMKLQPVGA